MAETTIETAVQALIDYAVAKSLITEDDEICVRNYLMDMLKLEKWEKPSVKEYGSVDEILDEIVDFAVEKEIIPQSNAWRDLFDTRIMGVFTGMPHEVNAKFKEKYAKSPEAATDWYYAYSEDTNYVRKGRIAKDIRWKYDSEYGQLDITINRSKPEKIREILRRQEMLRRFLIRLVCFVWKIRDLQVRLHIPQDRICDRYL